MPRYHNPDIFDGDPIPMTREERDAAYAPGFYDDLLAEIADAAGVTVKKKKRMALPGEPVEPDETPEGKPDDT